MAPMTSATSTTRRMLWASPMSRGPARVIRDRTSRRGSPPAHGRQAPNSLRAMAQRYAYEMAQNGKRAAAWSTDDDRDLMAQATMVMVTGCTSGRHTRRRKLVGLPKPGRQQPRWWRRR
jgi:hypothetical protein